MLAALLLLVSVHGAAAAEPEESRTLAIFGDEEATPLPSPATRPVSKIAENVTVITADDISRLNAHTLADVLQTIPGIQLDYLRTPGSFTFFNIQGALNSNVLVLIDGIRQNDFDQGIASPGVIPVQQIERIEIVKGAASGSWGSALGGVVNIVTKTPDPDRAVSGMVSASTGTRFTADSRAELSGTVDRFGYYLSAGHLRSDGFTANTATTSDNLYGKISYALPGGGTTTLGLSRVADLPGQDEGDTAKWGFVHDNSTFRRDYGFLRFEQPIGDRLNLAMQGYATRRDDHAIYGGRDGQGNIVYFSDSAVNDWTRGLSGSLTWGDRRTNLVAGAEYAHLHAEQGDLVNPPPTYDRTLDSYALYLNGTFSVGNLSVLPGVRVDQTGPWGERTSSCLGLAYELGEKTTLRAYAAQGFSLPKLVDDTGIQRVKTVQAGVETGVFPFLWLKGTYFFNALRNTSSSGGTITVTDQDIQGYELELRTSPAYGFSLSGGYTYLYAVDVNADRRLQTNSQQSIPSQVYKVALHYDRPELGLRGTVTGSGVVWNAAPDFQASSRGMAWDLNLNWRPFPERPYVPELFFSAHNLFNAVQTTYTTLYTNAMRWFEGGARLRF
ncbi:TonB-dependent receptor plug domain-containing protein [Geomonas sp. Red32]|uniref:TonB-dependent receptor plug domain-containing protein n=1 Tax=Geomonas sp. Red32 TaxID=2912856 RepID=UPI00202CE221|nr:TonB-dependent receptor plug domain-containing protein [Geomonas sp. Red32]